ncbi:MAG TPA: SRPBCC family protein [Paracoccaceae bacterium]|nr:SRPBCC family protein [Paracoccaceae bacterium]
MTERSTVHATITVERTYGAEPARVFRAWADPALRVQWDVPGEGWETVMHAQDFRVGGRERSIFGPKGAANIRSEGWYLDIVPERRIVSAGTMHEGDARISSTLCTVELLPEGEGARVLVTDQTAYFEGRDKPEWREGGWGTILDRLGAFLAPATAH